VQAIGRMTLLPTKDGIAIVFQQPESRREESHAVRAIGRYHLAHEVFDLYNPVRLLAAFSIQLRIILRFLTEQ
jgi:hypothetical protein